MRSLIGVIFYTFLTASFWSNDVAAHHSFSVDFSSETGTIEGEVVQVFYRNPHVNFYIKTTNADGEEEIWAGFGQSLRVMMRAGWRKNTVKLGDTLKIEGNLGRNSTKKIAIVKATKSDGTELMLFRGGVSYIGGTKDSQIKDDKVEK